MKKKLLASTVLDELYYLKYQNKSLEVYDLSVMAILTSKKSIKYIITTSIFHYQLSTSNYKSLVFKLGFYTLNNVENYKCNRHIKKHNLCFKNIRKFI